MSYRNAETAVLWTTIATWTTVVAAAMVMTRLAL